MSAHKLKSYKLPSVEQLRIGAGQGALGGLCAGAVSAIAFIACLLLVTARKDGGPGAGEGFSLLGAIIYGVCMGGLYGAVTGCIVGLFTGIASYFIITPWVASNVWPDLAQPLKRGMLVGSLVGVLSSGTLIAVVDSSPAYLPAFLVKDRAANLLYGVLLCIIGCIIGGFLNQLRVVVLPSLAKGDWED